MWTGKYHFDPYIKSEQGKWGKFLQSFQISSNSKDKVNNPQCIFTFDHTKHNAASKERGPVLLPAYFNNSWLCYFCSTPFHEIQQPWSQRYTYQRGKETKVPHKTQPMEKNPTKPNFSVFQFSTSLINWSNSFCSCSWARPSITQVDRSCLAGITAGYLCSDGYLWLLQIIMQTTP